MSLRLTFAGEAQTLQGTDGHEFSGDILVIPPDGGRTLNFIMRTDRSVKGSDLPPGMGVLASWVTPEQYVFEFSGLIFEPGTEVTFRSVQGFRGDFSSDAGSLLLR